jgi:adenosylhomocysteine nucleosidase/5'-methylthioadenosine nucleosidase
MELMLSEGAVVKEMEAAAVAWVCKQVNIPFAALKGVTDLVDGGVTTREEFESNLERTAAGAMSCRLFGDTLFGRF